MEQVPVKLGRWAEATDISSIYPRPCGPQASPRSTGNLFRNTALSFKLLLGPETSLVFSSHSRPTLPHLAGGLQTKDPETDFPFCKFLLLHF